MQTVMYYRISEYREIAMDFNGQKKSQRNLKNGKNSHRHLRREEHDRKLKRRPKAFLGQKKLTWLEQDVHKGISLG